MIGIFDSGIGGLPVINALRQKLPDTDLIYFGDTARSPYGKKSAKTVSRYVLENIEALIHCGALAIVIACHTSSSIATRAARRQFDLPIFEVIDPAVRLALQITKNNEIGVIGTQATINSGVYAAKIGAMNAEAKVYSIASPLLVPLVEEGWERKPETVRVVKKYLHPLKVRQIDTLILGCNHYVLLKNIIQRKVGKRVQLIDAATVVSDNLVEFLEKQPEISNPLGKNKMLRLIFSDVTPQIEKAVQVILKQKVKLELI